MPKELKGKRVEQMDFKEFSPCTPADLRTLRSFIVSDDRPLKISRTLLSRVVLERERLIYVVAAAQMRRDLILKAETVERAAIEQGDPGLSRESGELHARAEALLDQALEALEGAGSRKLIDPKRVVRQMLGD